MNKEMVLPISPKFAPYITSLPLTLDHDRRGGVANATIAAAVVDPTQKPRVGSTVDMCAHPLASSFDDQGRFGCVVRCRITGHRRATSRRRDGLERRPSS